MVPQNKEQLGLHIAPLVFPQKVEEEEEEEHPLCSSSERHPTGRGNAGNG